MINVDIFRDAFGLIVAYKVSGHAYFAEAGKDIICCSVSVMTQVPLLGLERYLKLNPSYKINERDGILEVELNTAPNEDTQAILATMELGLQDLAEDYPEHVRIHNHRR